MPANNHTELLLASLLNEANYGEIQIAELK